MRYLVGWVVLLVVTGRAAQAQAQQTITKLEIRRQDPAKTDKLLKDQLSRIFKKEDRRTKERPSQPLDWAWFSTEPYGTRVPGLCRVDSAVLNLAPVERVAEPDEQTPMRAYGISTSAHFYFVNAPKGWYAEVAQAGRLPWQRECEGIDNGDFFSAKDDELATNGMRAMLLAQQGVAAGELKPEHCNLGGLYATCALAFAGFGRSGLADIEPCAVVPAGRECYAIEDNDDTRIEVVIRDPSTPDHRTANSRMILSVNLEAQIILRHPRPD